MFLDCLDTLVTLMAIVSTVDMDEAGDIGEPLYTDQPLSTKISMANGGKSVSTEKRVLQADITLPSDAPLQTTEGVPFLPGDLQLTTERPNTEKLPTQEWNSFFPRDTTDAISTPKGNSILPGASPFTGEPQLLPEGITRETPSSNGPQIAEGWEWLLPDVTPSTDGPQIAESWETVSPSETPFTNGPQEAEGGSETVLPRGTPSSAEYITPGKTGTFLRNMTLLAMEKRDTTTHGERFVEKGIPSTSDPFLTSGNNASANSLTTSVHGERTTPLKRESLQTTWKSTTDDNNNAWSTVAMVTSSEGDGMLLEESGVIGEISDCREALCTYVYGVHSECIVSAGPDTFDENIRTTTPSLLDVIDADLLCRCKPGYSFQSGNCIDVQYLSDLDLSKCCTDEECELKMGVNSECGMREGGNPEVCNSLEGLRPRRDIGTVVTPSVTSNWVRQGDCICKTGYDLVDGQCKETNVMDEPRNGVTNSTVRPTETTGSTVQSSNPSNKRCQEWRCTGKDCGQRQGLVGDYCSPLEGNAVCYVSKLCGFGGDDYIFGCKDPCNNQTGSESRGCFTVTCLARDIACNYETLEVDEFQCSREEAVRFSVNVLVVLTTVVFSLV